MTKPTPSRLCTVCLLVSIAALNGWVTWHADVPNAYLNGPCPKLVLVQLPRLWNEIMEDFIGQNREAVIMANSLYGAPDAGCNWNKRFTDVFLREGYHWCPKKPCLFTKWTENEAYETFTDVAFKTNEAFQALYEEHTHTVES